jgi:tRNA pseudouridine38-40 synthase
MTHWKLTLAYDGTPYHGWQVQPGLPTIQGTLADAIYRTMGERVLPQGSGRTDAGVHALAQVASFALNAPIPADNLQHALNRCLPPSIRVLCAETAPPSFHARHCAIRKTYEYRIFSLRQATTANVPHSSQSHRDDWDANPSSAPDRICPPTLAPYVWPCPWPLSLDTLNQAAAHILGTHDFTTFAATDPDQSSRADSEESAKTPIRTIHHSHWHAHEDLLIYRVTGSGFLHHMVRNLVGTFVQAGSRRLDPDEIPNLIAARSRALCGATAPATGLFLVSVEYPEPVACAEQRTPEYGQLP